MKKILSMALISIMLVLALAGCAAKTTPAGTDADLAIACELTSEEYGIGFRKGSDLTAVVNGYMAELKEAGVLDELAAKYELTLSDLAPAEEEEATLADVDYVKANGKLVIGITDYEPMNFKDAEDNWTGFDTEFALAVCEKLGVTAEFVEIDWDNKFVALESKAIDCIWNGMTISEDVLKNTSCSAAYVKNAQVVVMAADKAADYADAASMAELSFAVESGSAGAAAAEENAFANVTEVGTQTDALLEVTSGSCDACIIDLTMANAMVK
ncbi:MAG: transporter substrate-binding domain-containing protein [Ruminococcaceae bacterium]|nr:transporter substrate-binding domain-containing protein [Oscillospiraceae bacterium]